MEVVLKETWNFNNQIYLFPLQEFAKTKEAVLMQCHELALVIDVEIPSTQHRRALTSLSIVITEASLAILLESVGPWIVKTRSTRLQIEWEEHIW